LGADIVIHSLTKFFSGHADVMGGAVSVGCTKLAKKIAFYQNAEGTALAPFDCWVFLRGIKTMHIRLKAAQENALAVARFLRDNHLVTNVYYVGLKPQESDSEQRKKFYEIHQRQSKGGGSVISFTTGNPGLSKRIINALRIFKCTVSFGSVNSLCEMPCAMSHASIPAEERTIPEDLVRLSIGIEDKNDLLSDLKDAFEIAESLKDYEPVGKYDSLFEDLKIVPTPRSSANSDNNDFPSKNEIFTSPSKFPREEGAELRNRWLTLIGIGVICGLLIFRQKQA